MLRTCHRSIYLQRTLAKNDEAKEREKNKGQKRRALPHYYYVGDKPTVKKKREHNQYLVPTNLKITFGIFIKFPGNGAKKNKNYPI